MPEFTLLGFGLIDKCRVQSVLHALCSKMVLGHENCTAKTIMILST
jgi:hypothetical protein